jgi:uncharacterized protein
MSAEHSLPRAARPFVAFAALLRREGFLAAPEQTASFLAAIELLGPSSIVDIRRAAHATFAPPPERRAEFDALFDLHFLGVSGPLPTETAASADEVPVRDSAHGSFDVPIADDSRDAGQAAAALERLSTREFQPVGDDAVLRRFERAAPERLPRRRGYRRRPDRHGRDFDLRGSLRDAVRHDGEMIRLRRLRRRSRQRRILLLIDVSGSMKRRTEAHLRFAHVLTRAAQRVEVFTIGTRLTRVTAALRLKRRDQALAAASALVADWDGGTRIGGALQAFLAVQRFVGYARGALVVVVSDGLERGDHSAMMSAVARLGALAWRVLWLTPLAADPGFVPETAALKSILPLIDDLADGSSTERLCANVLGAARSTNAGASGARSHRAADAKRTNNRLPGERDGHAA